MPLKITQQQQAQENLITLAKLLCNGNNDGDVHVGLMKIPNGPSRFVKFDAGGESLTPEMKDCCKALREEMEKWKESLNDEEMNWFCKHILPEQEKANPGSVVSLMPFVKRIVKGFEIKDPQGNVIKPNEDFFKHEGFAKGKPLSFEATKKALLSDVRFTYTPCKQSDRGIAIGNAVAKRSTFSNVLHAIGRGIMTATHALKAFFTGRVFSKAWGETVNDYKTLAGAAGANEKWQLPKLDEKPIDFDAHVVASSCGLSGEILIRPFAKGEKLFPEGSPSISISDIKQDPALQDCWFLSSLAAVLRSQGAEYIKGLIDTQSKPGSALVRLGAHKYKVPLGDVLVDGKQVVSDSKPWVRILEQAMAMHIDNRMTNASDLKKDKMSFGTPMEAINALLGKEEDNGVVSMMYNGTNINSVRTAFAGGIRPVVLGSNGGAQGIAASLGTGISPGHACAVIAVGEKHVTVLDPYGHVRHVPASDLKNFKMMYVSDSDWTKGVGNRTDSVNKPVDQTYVMSETEVDGGFAVVGGEDEEIKTGVNEPKQNANGYIDGKDNDF